MSQKRYRVNLFSLAKMGLPPEEKCLRYCYRPLGNLTLAHLEILENYETSLLITHPTA